MIKLYRKRSVQGKCEANRFLMNLAAREDDSEAIARDKIDKAVMIQNLFQRLSERGRSLEIFLNYSLDTRLYPMRRAGLVELVDNHPQVIENKRKFMSGPATA
jgi:hypothetical protein